MARLKKGDTVEWETSRGATSGKVVEKLTSRRKIGDLTGGDHAHMRKVSGDVHRHLEQRPKGDVSETPWRDSLMN